MGVTTTKTNKPLNPRGNDQSPLAYNRAKLYSGKALDFDGVNDEVNCGDINVAFSEISFAFHFNADSFSNNCIFQKESVFRFIGVNTNQIDIVLATTGNSWYSKKMTLTNLESKDYFLVATYNGSELKAYLNGVLVDTLGGYSGSVASVSQNVYVGRTNGGLYYNGKVSGARIFNTALTAAQVSDLYNNPEKVVPTGVDNTALKLWLPMMEGAGTTAYDGSGNGNHGTISGATYVNGVGAPVSQSAVMDWNKGTNLAKSSGDVSTDSGQWSANQLATTTANYAESPDGSTTASKVTPNATQNYSGVIQSTTLTNGKTYTFSAYLRTESGSKNVNLLVLDGDSNFYNGNQSIDDTWQRYTNTFTVTGATGGGGLYITSFLEAKEFLVWGAQLVEGSEAGVYTPTLSTAQTSPVLLPQGLTSGRDITGVNLFENVRKQGALNLDGNSWAEVHDNASLDITSEITLEAWVYWSDPNTEGILGRFGALTADRSYMLYAPSPTSVEFYINTSQSNYTSMTNGWRHIVGTYNGAQRKLYVDGVLRDTDGMTAAITTSDKPIEIGRYRHGSVSNLEHDGQLAQPRIYNRALTAEEVQRNYNAGKNIYTN